MIQKNEKKTIYTKQWSEFAYNGIFVMNCLTNGQLGTQTEVSRACQVSWNVPC